MDPNHLEQGFWQVETSSLRDFPQQFRTFQIYLNKDYTVSIVTTNVDPAVAAGSPAATSRQYAIATQQIVQSNLQFNANNISALPNGAPVTTVDPTRKQDGSADASIYFTDLTNPAVANPPVPYHASNNAELFKQLSPQMIAFLQSKYPAS